MATLDSNIVKLAPEAGTPAYRVAPHNIEAEQGLLGAILVNNDASTASRTSSSRSISSSRSTSSSSRPRRA